MSTRTHFASPERTAAPELHEKISCVANNPLIDTLMCTSCSLFAVLNRHRQILALNQNFLNVMGIHDPEAALGLRPGEYLHCIHATEMPAGCGTSAHCSECGAVLAILAAMDSDAPQEHVCELKATRNGTQVEMTFQVKCSRTVIDNELFLLLFLQDIAPVQQQAYEELKHIIETAHDGFLALSTDGLIVDTNRSFCQMTGYERAEVVGQPVSTFCPAGEPHMTPHLADSIQSVNPFFESRIQRKDGSIRALEVSGTYANRHGGRIYCFCRDITERKLADERLHEQAVLLEAEIAERQKAQEALSAINSSLEARIAAAVAELRQKDEQLISQNRMAAMGKLLTNISHHWRQPLNNIAAQLQAMRYLHQQGELTDDELDRDVSDTVNTVTTLSQTIDDFRQLVRPDCDRCSFVVHDLITSCVQLLSATCAENAIQVVVHGDDSVSATGLPHEYAQSIINILDNARDAFGERHTEHPQIVITVSRSADRSVVTICDNAGGIPEEVMPHIFEPYFSTKKPTAATGLGLYMAKVLIEQHMGGTLTACNAGDGAEFRIELE